MKYVFSLAAAFIGCLWLFLLLVSSSVSEMKLDQAEIKRLAQILSNLPPSQSVLGYRRAALG